MPADVHLPSFSEFCSLAGISSPTHSRDSGHASTFDPGLPPLHVSEDALCHRIPSCSPEPFDNPARMAPGRRATSASLILEATEYARTDGGGILLDDLRSEVTSPAFSYHFLTRPSNHTLGYGTARCPRCQLEVQVPLENPEAHWAQHTSSTRCRNMQDRLAQAEVNRQATAMRAHLFPSASRRSRYHPYSQRSHGTAQPSSFTRSFSEPINIRRATETISETRPSSSPATPTSGPACHGVHLPWTAGPVLSTVPLHLFHERRQTLGCHVSGLRDEGTKLWVQSDTCLRVAPDNEQACFECVRLLSTRPFQALHDRAIAPWREHTPYDLLNSVQARDALGEKASQVRSLRDTLRRARKSLTRVESEVRDYRALINAIAVNDTLRVGRLVDVALRRGCSVPEVLKRVEAAASEVYRVKSYSKTELDLARLMRHLAGDKGSYILHKALGLPSSTTIKRWSDAPTLLPCSSFPNVSDISSNLNNFYPVPPSEPVNNAAVVSPKRRGYLIMADGIATDPRVRRVRQTDKMVGICREHVGDRDMSMSKFPNVVGLAQAVRSPNPNRPHVSSETTVFALAGLGRYNYHARAVLASNTCKFEKAAGFRRVKNTVSNTWDEQCASTYGDVWAICTDAGQAMRMALWQDYTELIFDGRLFDMLSRLPGFNLACGKGNVVYCPDPKHLFKRCGTLLRSPEGMLVMGVVIDHVLLEKMLLYVPGQTAETVASLFKPTDHQNVPLAMKLLYAIHNLGELDPIAAGMAPDERIAHRPIKILGRLFKVLLDAFINPNMSLSEHLRSLSTFSHLADVLFIEHGSGFMSNQLFSDLLLLARDIYVFVSQQQLLDPEVEFFPCQAGSDKLEELFAEVRTQSHDRNVDILQLCERITIATDIVQILHAHATWNRPHRRLAFSGPNGEIDHVNPSFFKGDMVAGNVDLEAVWNAGRRDAEEILKGVGVRRDIGAILESHGGDLLRPNGEFVGISLDRDRSILPEEEAEGEGIIAGQSDQPQEAVSGGVDLLDVAISVDYESGAVTSEHQRNDWLDVPRSLEDESDPRPVHKATILDGLFNSGLTALSFDRLRRVRGYTKFLNAYRDEGLRSQSPRPNHRESDVSGVEHQGDSDSSNASGTMNESDQDPSYDKQFDKEFYLNVQDFAVAPVLADGVVALGLIKICNIQVKGKRVAYVHEDTMDDLTAKVVISGQVLCLQRQETVPESDANDHVWLWTGTYARFDPVRRGKTTTTGPEAGNRSANVIQVPGHLVYPIEETTASTALLPPQFRADFEAQGFPPMYAIGSASLARIMDQTYKTVDPAELAAALTKYGPSDAFPYRDHASQLSSFVLDNATCAAVTVKAHGDEKLACFQCGSGVRRRELRGHVGKHILRELLKEKEEGLLEKIDLQTLPCGFCGRGNCEVGLEKKSTKSTQGTSKCARAFPYSLTSANKSTITTPSTNVPIECLLCEPNAKSKQRPVFWKYNIFYHIQSQHPRYWDAHNQRTQGLSTAFISFINISPDEVGRIAPAHTLPYPVPATGSAPAIGTPSNTTSAVNSNASSASHELHAIDTIRRPKRAKLLHTNIH